MASCVDESGDVDGFVVSKTKPGVGVAATPKYFPVGQEERRSAHASNLQ